VSDVCARRALGGSVPSVVEVRCPALDVSLRLDLPAHENWALVYAAFSRARVLAMCEDALRRVPDWQHLVDSAARDGEGGLELAWRRGTVLDWVAADTDVDGAPRGWAALWGLALRGPATLEFRKAQHYATHLRLGDGARLVEPPAVEGYVDRIRAGTQARHAQYVATHDGLLVFSAHAHAHAPPPPGTRRAPDEPAPEAAHSAGSRRGAQQLLAADGVVDMRAVLCVRRAFQPVLPRRDADVADMADAARRRPPWEAPGADEERRPRRARSACAGASSSSSRAARSSGSRSVRARMPPRTAC
jgi:hypothetical protein